MGRLTENKRFVPSGKWIKDNYIGNLLNIDFNTITDMNLCCNLLNQLEDEKKRNGKIATKYFEESNQLKKELFESEKDYIMETYSDNPIRRDEKIQSLKEEFKARFGDVE